MWHNTFIVLGTLEDVKDTQDGGCKLIINVDSSDETYIPIVVRPGAMKEIMTKFDNVGSLIGVKGFISTCDGNVRLVADKITFMGDNPEANNIILK